jgi:hypothetical protein
MTYNNYLKFYGLTDTKENQEAWKYTEWNHGRAFKESDKFYDIQSGKELK